MVFFPAKGQRGNELQVYLNTNTKACYNILTKCLLNFESSVALFSLNALHLKTLRKLYICLGFY